jgi:hypothetical protein
VFRYYPNPIHKYKIVNPTKSTSSRFPTIFPIFRKQNYFLFPYKKRDLIHTQHHHNNHTTIPHMRVGPSVWGPPSCEGLLCDCCVGVVNLTFSIKKYHTIDFLTFPISIKYYFFTLILFFLSLSYFLSLPYIN